MRVKAIDPSTAISKDGASGRAGSGRRGKAAQQTLPANGNGQGSVAVKPSKPPKLERGFHGRSSWIVVQGDALTTLPMLEEESVNCVVTSPPYFWQRDYDIKGQLGLEPSIQGYVDNLRTAFRGIWGALKSDGTVFLNLGDTYYSAKGEPHGDDAKHRARRFGLRAVDASGLGLPRKSLIGIPWRVALALAEDGWTLRSSIVWVRQSAIPEPTARDRPWRKYEHIFLLSKSPRYYFNRLALENEEDVWEIEPDRNAESRGTHFAPFPRKLVERCIAAGCPDGGVVLDPFVGGGTTMYVALRMGRSAIGIDLNPSFCDLIVSRLGDLKSQIDPETGQRQIPL
jgi:DNA modification methylase